ncbi:protein dcd1A-like [Amphiura filiformis]|uniref:protein dcd1A-like n=1 Tax=Amphiura filiformis TaxID=82378 RepID=UPI003B21909C
MRLLVLLALAVVATVCSGKPDPNAKPNENPIQTAAPVFVKQAANGKLYTAGQGDDKFYLLHVWGTPYEMGFAHGTLLKEEATDLLDSVWQYLEDQVIEAINGTVKIFRPWFLEDVSNFGLDVALDLEILATEKYSGKYFLEEIKGLGTAAGVDYRKIQRIHMLGELTKGDCSMFGAWNSAVPKPGTILQLRALDWNVDGPFKNHPQVTVYHPNSGNGRAFANLGWSGWIGSITGMNDRQMAISEIGVSYPDDSFGSESRFGIPFTYILRDVLQFDNTLDDAVNRMANAHRTCNLILGVGDGKLGTFRGVQYSYAVSNFFDDKNLRPDATWHPKIPDVVYWGMDWLDADYSSVLARQLTKYHGNITAENTIRDITAIVQTGDLHIAIYDLNMNYMYVANAKKASAKGAIYAYDRAFVKLDMKALFAEMPPQN